MKILSFNISLSFFGLLFFASCHSNPEKDAALKPNDMRPSKDTVRLIIKQEKYSFQAQLVPGPNESFEQWIPMPLFVQEWLIMPGTLVQKGQPVVRMQHPDLMAAGQSFIALTQEEQQKEQRWKHLEEAAQKGASGHEQAAAAKTDWVRCKAEREALGAKLISLGLDPFSPGFKPSAQIQLRAPKSGYLSEGLATEGALAGTDTKLFTLIAQQPSQFRIETLSKPEGLSLGDTLFDPQSSLSLQLTRCLPPQNAANPLWILFAESNRPTGIAPFSWTTLHWHGEVDSVGVIAQPQGFNQRSIKLVSPDGKTIEAQTQIDPIAGELLLDKTFVGFAVATDKTETADGF